jgi:hypothetical protein
MFMQVGGVSSALLGLHWSVAPTLLQGAVADRAGQPP